MRRLVLAVALRQIVPVRTSTLFVLILKAMADHEPFKVEARYRRADGVFRTMRTEARPRLDATDGHFSE